MDDDLAGWEVSRLLYGRSSFDEDTADFRETHHSVGWKSVRLTRCTHTMIYDRIEDEPPYQAGLPCEPGEELVYFIHAPEVRRVKVGWSTDPANRLSSMQVGSPCPLLIVKLLRGGKGLEKKIHLRFQHLRVDGEWFDDAILDEWVRDPL